MWFYEFADRNAPLDIPFPKDFDPGAWHAGDVGYIFRDAEAQRQMTKAQVDLSNEMIAYWTNFARGGDPNGEGLPRWPKFTGPASVQALRPAPDKSGPVDYAAEHRLAFWQG